MNTVPKTIYVTDFSCQVLESQIRAYILRMFQTEIVQPTPQEQALMDMHSLEQIIHITKLAIILFTEKNEDHREEYTRLVPYKTKIHTENGYYILIKVKSQVQKIQVEVQRRVPVAPVTQN